MRLNRTPDPLDRSARNDENENWSIIESTISKLEREIDSLILENSGDSNAEVVAARGGFRTLGRRLNDIMSQLADKIIKGNATLDDFDEEVRSLILGLEPGEINAVLGNRNVQRDNIAIGAVSPEETSFFIESNENLFDGRYIKAVYTWDSGRNDDFFLAANGYFDHDGRVVIFPVDPNETYKIKVYGEHDMFRVGIHNDAVIIPEGPAIEGSNNTENKFYTSTSLIDKVAGSEFTFQNTGTGKYGIIYISKTGEEPPITIYKESYLLKNEFIDFKEVTKQVEENIPERNVTVIENPKSGYRSRPNVTSVTWIGPNEPTEAEPFDEWRETEGFIYYTDFSEYELNKPPHDWSEKFTASASTREVIQSRNYGGNVYWLRLETNNAPYAQSFDRVDGEHLDSEIYMKVRLNRIRSGQPLAVVHRGKMNGYGKELYLIAGILNIDEGYFRAALKNENDDTAAHLARIPLREGFDPTEQYHQVSRVDGNRFRGKYWQVGAPEPKEWDFDVQIPNGHQMEPGFVGVYAYINTSDYYVYEYGVGTGGMKAPRRKVMT